MRIRCTHCFQVYDSYLGMCPYCGYVFGERSPNASALTPGTRILDRYIIGQILGLGGFGITYKAWDLQLGTVLAIKEYFPSGLVNRTPGDPNVVLMVRQRSQEFIRGKERFLYEARNMAKFSQHHNIVNVFNYFEANQTAYIVMEYLEGLTLTETLHRAQAPLSADACVSMALDLCDALESIHQEHMLHRDVSPDNIIFCPDGSVKLFDFGAARFALNSPADDLADAVVKPGFTPVEQYDRVSPQDERTDIYALGATMYYALTGKKPEESTDRQRQDELAPPLAISPETPEFLNNAVLRAMAIESRFRFENVGELRKVLREKTSPPTVETVQRRHKTRLFGGIAASIAAIAAAAGLFWFQWNSRSAQAVLPDGSVEVWYAATGDERHDLAAAEAWKQVVDAFTTQYPNVTVEAVGIDQAEYPQKLAEAKSSGSMPDLYESTHMERAELSGAVSLAELLSRSRENVYLDGLGQSDLQYPTELTLPVIYVNTSLGSMPDAGSLEAMANACQDLGGKLLLQSQYAAMYQALYGSDAAGYAEDDALEQFLEGKCIIYLGSTAEYLQVQEGLMGNGVGTYGVALPDVGEAVYEYGCLWSLWESDPDTQRIATALLGYLNTDLGQDHFNIRSFSENGTVPVTRTALVRYTESYVELAGICEYLKLPYAPS